MKLALLPLVAAVLAGDALAQTIDWLRVAPDDGRLVSAPELGVDDVQEKDYAWADLDGDGWTDLVVVRKEPFSTPGRFPNVFFHNEGGVLVDRTFEYASASDVPGDEGFLTPTNDRDVIVVDVDLDGWLDVVTAPTISPGEPKSISHPRVYRNLGEDVDGAWLGLLYEDARILDWGTHANFCGVGAGDVTGDGYPDLFFAHYDTGAEVDLNDRLLVNDGAGYFTDESEARMSAEMRESVFGTSATIVDVNGDGAADVVTNQAFFSRILYNDPDDVGFFNIYDTPPGGLPYHISVGDLNNDGKPDLVVSEDANDRYVLNQGNDPLGRVKWSPAHNYNTDDGFGGNNLAVDIDGDGWQDTVHCDVDVDSASCERRMHVFHNRGGTVGGFVTLHEESGGGHVGANGWTPDVLRATHDVAVFDVDNDGDMDFVIGRCEGTGVWLAGGAPEIGVPYCDPAVPNSTGQPGRIVATGSTAVAQNELILTAEQLPTQQFGYFLLSQTQGFVPGPGGSQGNLCLGGALGRYAKSVLSSGTEGRFALGIDLTDVPKPTKGFVEPGDTWSFQAWYRDKNPQSTSNFTNGVEIQFF